MKHSKLTGLSINLFVVGLFLVVIYLLAFANPSEIGPQGILVLLLCVYFVLSRVLYLLAKFTLVLLCRNVNPRIIAKLPKFAIAFTFGIVVLVAINSLGQLGVADLLLVVIFEVITIFYISKR